MSRTDPTLLEAVEAALTDVQARVRTLIPATVIAYNPATNTATVQPSRLQQPADGGTPTPLPQITGPVIWPRTGAWVMWTDLLPGDSVAIMVADRSIAEWRKSPPGTPVAPKGGRMHSLTDAVILPGLWPDVSPPLTATGRVPGSLYIGNALGTSKVTLDPAQVIVEGPLVRLGQLSASFAIKGTDLSVAVTSFAGSVSTLTGALGTAAGVWGAAATAWAGVPAGAPAFAAASTAFGTAVASFCTGLATACTALATQTAAALSVKVQVQ